MLAIVLPVAACAASTHLVARGPRRKPDRYDHAMVLLGLSVGWLGATVFWTA